MKCKYCDWNGPASVEDDELARCPRCGEDTIKAIRLPNGMLLWKENNNTYCGWRKNDN